MARTGFGSPGTKRTRTGARIFPASAPRPVAAGCTSRAISVCAFYANGRVQAPSADVSTVLDGRGTRFAELPHLQFDGAGSLWMGFRHWTFSTFNEIYHFYATRLSGDHWIVPVRLSQSSGHNSQHAALGIAPDSGLTIGYASDGRSQTVFSSDPMHARHYSVYVSTLPKGQGPPAVTCADLRLGAPQNKPAPRPRATMTSNGQTYHLFHGRRATGLAGHFGPQRGDRRKLARRSARLSMAVHAKDSGPDGAPSPSHFR